MRNHEAEAASAGLGLVRSSPEGAEAEAIVHAILSVQRELAEIREMMSADRDERLRREREAEQRERAQSQGRRFP